MFVDGLVIEVLYEIFVSGWCVVFYLFILMEQMVGNGWFDLWSGVLYQLVMLWCGCIMLSIVLGCEGMFVGIVEVVIEVVCFFGSVQVSQFQVEGMQIIYIGFVEWFYCWFILYYVYFCVVVGGIDVFLIGLEMVGLMQIQVVNGMFLVVV